MFKKVDVPVCIVGACRPPDLAMLTQLQNLGMIQNMSVFICPQCNLATHIFGAEGVSRLCTSNGLDFLGDIPLHASICNDADRGKPTLVAEPESERSAAFLDIARKLQVRLNLEPR